MLTLRRFSYLALATAFTHLVFGAIVRISGSGMGCGDHWPKCHGQWLPPMNDPLLVIEWTHRLLAVVLLASLLLLAVTAWRKRAEPGVAGKGGVLRPALATPMLWLVPALLGAITVFLGNPPGATVAHWIVAMGLVAIIAATGIRAGALGGSSARMQQGTARAARSARAAAVFALVIVAMGGLTAKIPSGAVACLDFPLCGANPAAPVSAVHVQLTHRVLAFLFFFHLLGTVIVMRRRSEAPIVKRAAFTAFSLVILQMLVAGAMIGMKLPPVLRSLHEAVGVSIWIATFTFAYLARIAARTQPAAAIVSAPPKTTPPHTIAVIVARGADL